MGRNPIPTKKIGAGKKIDDFRRSIASKVTNIKKSKSSPAVSVKSQRLFIEPAAKAAQKVFVAGLDCAMTCVEGKF
jgi:hypothetical protein